MARPTNKLSEKVKMFYRSERLSQYLPHYVAAVVTLEFLILLLHI